MIAKDLLAELWKKRTGRISTQVCNEYYVTVTQKLKPGLSKDEAWQDVEALLGWQPLSIDTRVLQKARNCQIHYKISWWDSLIISAAFFLNCTTILSEDLNNQQDYFGIKVKNPFAK